MRGVTFFVARNSKRAEFRRLQTWKRQCAALDAEHLVTTDATGETDEGEAASRLAQVLAVLSPLDRALLVGQVWEGLSTKELAIRHEISDAVVRQRLARARQTARRSILETKPH